jgi:hypothetical protein
MLISQPQPQPRGLESYVSVGGTMEKGPYLPTYVWVRMIHAFNRCLFPYHV